MHIVRLVESGLSISLTLLPGSNDLRLMQSLKSTLKLDQKLFPQNALS